MQYYTPHDMSLTSHEIKQNIRFFLLLPHCNYTHWRCAILSQSILRSVSVYGSSNNDLEFSACTFLFLKFFVFLFFFCKIPAKEKEHLPCTRCWLIELHNSRSVKEPIFVDSINSINGKRS